jgi:hypothetical protein
VRTDTASRTGTSGSPQRGCTSLTFAHDRRWIGSPRAKAPARRIPTRRPPADAPRAPRALRHSAPHARGGRFQAEAALRGRWERALANRPIRVVSRQPGRSAASTRKRKPPSRCEGWSSRLFAGQQHAIAQKDLSGARAATSSPGRQAGPLFSTTSEAPASDSHDAGHARTVAPVPPESRGASPRSEAHHPPPPHPEALRRSFAVARQGVLSWGRRVFRRSSGW